MLDGFKMNKVSDERHLAYFDVFPLASGQINISKIYPRTIVAWHRHQEQIDQWFVLNGMLKIGLKYPDKPAEFKLLGPGESITIEFNVWHGYMALTETDLIYWCSSKYNPKKPDEEREMIGKFGEQWEGFFK
mgnify:CR=1 FL=1